MQLRFNRDRQRLWKIIRNPAVEVVAAIMLVLFAAWVVVATETESHHSAFPLPYSRR